MKNTKIIFKNINNGEVVKTFTIGDNYVGNYIKEEIADKAINPDDIKFSILEEKTNSIEAVMHDCFLNNYSSLGVTMIPLYIKTELIELSSMLRQLNIENSLLEDISKVDKWTPTKIIENINNKLNSLNHAFGEFGGCYIYNDKYIIPSAIIHELIACLDNKDYNIDIIEYVNNPYCITHNLKYASLEDAYFKEDNASTIVFKWKKEFIVPNCLSTAVAENLNS